MNLRLLLTSDPVWLMRKTKYGLELSKLGIRALALFQLYLAYLVLIGAGFGLETLEFTLKAAGALMLVFLTYLLWIGSGAEELKVRIQVALGCIGVGLLPLLANLTELIMGNWTIKEWILLGYFLTGLGAILEMYGKDLRDTK